jgi:hypothetical protein
MSDFLNFLRDHQTGIWVLFFMIIGVAVLFHYTMWVFALGRFSNRESMKPRERLNFVLADAAVKIINDFRHLLALLILVVFSLILGYAVVKGGTDGTGIKDSLQAVMATLGGLVGSIIGYYFGESSARSSAAVNPVVNPPVNPAGTGVSIQNDVNPGSVEDIKPAPALPPEN